MPDQNPTQLPAAEEFGAVPQASERFGNVPNDSEAFRIVRNDSESFRTFPNGSEGFRSVPKGSERKEDHTLTVREAARLFESAGVARTERSIVNWCQLNAQGVARLDAYYDPNERKYYISPQSVDRAIQEEIAKAAKVNEPVQPLGTVPKGTERRERPDIDSEPARLKELEKELLDLKITNRGKDYFIEQLQNERREFVEQAALANRKVGELETRLLQLEAPANQSPSVEETPRTH